MGYSKKTNKPADNGGKTTGGAPSAQWSSRIRPVAIAAIVAILASIAFLVVRRGTGTEEQGTGDKGEKVQRQRPARTSQPTQPPSTNRTAKANADNKAEKPEKPPFVKRPGAMQLPDGRVLTFAPPKEGEFRIVHSHGSTYKCDHLGNWVDVTPKPIFDNSFEEALVGLSSESGAFIPGMLLGIPYEDAIRMLTKPVVINEDDSEDVIKKKEAVAAAKEAILDYMKDGASLDDFVMEMRKQVVKEKFIRGMALKEIVASLKEGRVQDAADMRDAANKMLEKDSLPALKLPAHIENAIKENK